MKYKLFFLMLLMIAVLTGVVFADNIVDDLTAFSAGTNAASFGDSDNSEYGAGSEWTSSADATVTNIAVKLRSTGSPTKDYVMDIYTVSGNLPNTLVGTSNRFDPSVVGATYGMHNFSFNGTPISNGVRYMFGVHYYDDTYDGTNNIISGGLFNGAATGSYLVRDGGAGWGVWSTNWGIYIQVWNGTYNPPTSNFTITASNNYDASTINNFTANITYNGSTWTYNTTTGTIITNISTGGLANITISANNYFSNSTLNHNTSNALNQILTPWTAIYAKDNNTGTYIQNYTIIYDGTNYTTTNGVAYIPLYNVISATVEFHGLGEYNNINTTLNASNYLQNYTFSVYPDPSVVYVTIYDADTASIITENISLIVSGNSYSQTFTTTTGNVYIGNLTAGIFTFTFSNANYTTTTYTLTVGTNTYQELNAWLSTNTSDLRFIIRDWDSGAIIEDVTTTMQRIINNTWETVESKQTDITGRVLFQYVENVRYRFTITKTGYTTRTFELNPVDPLIATTGYTVRMRLSTIATDPANFAGISRTLTPSRYTAGNQTVSLTLFSPDGAFQSYGITINYPGGSNSSTGSNTYGETLLTSIEIINPTLGDTVNITYWYDHTTQGNRSYTAKYFIDINSSAYTWTGIRDTNYGFTTLEKALIATFATIVFAGVATYFGGFLGGGIIALICFGAFYWMGFLTLWMILPSMFGGLFLIIWRSTS